MVGLIVVDIMWGEVHRCIATLQGRRKQRSGHRLMQSGRMLTQKFFDLRRSEVNSRAF